MTKAFKKGFAAVLSVMMVLCFMPSMAFATSGQSVTWDTNRYPSVTVTEAGKTNTFKTKRTFGETGLITAEPQKIPNTNDTLGGQSNAVDVPAGVGNKYFTDFDGAKILYEGKALDGRTMTLKFYQSFKPEDLRLQLVKPSYATAGKKDATVALDGVANVNIEPIVKGFDPNKSAEDQKVTISFDISAKDETTGELNGHEDFFDGIKDITFTVKGEAKPAEEPTTETAEVYLDSADPKTGVKKDGILQGNYDGEAHKVVAKAFEGWTAAFEVYNSKTGKWDAKNEISLTNVADKVGKFRVTYTKAGKEAVKVVFAGVELGKATASFGFDQAKSVSDSDTDFVYHVTGEAYNANDYVTVITGKRDKASEKAVKANEKALKEYFEAAFEVKADVASPKANPDTVTLTIKSKKDEKDIKAAKEKYAELLANFNEINVEEDAEEATLYKNTKEIVLVYVDEVTVEEGTMPTLTFTVKKSVRDPANDYDYKEVTLKDFDKSLLHFTTAGGQELNKVKPGIYDLQATADKYTVHVVGEKQLIVKAKASKAKTVKQNQTMSVETKDVKVKAKKKTKKNKTVAPIVKVSGNKGKLSYKKVSGGSKFSVNSKTGKVTVKKGTKKGTYKVKIKVSAAATKAYKATSMTVTVKIKVGK